MSSETDTYITDDPNFGCELVRSPRIFDLSEIVRSDK